MCHAKVWRREKKKKHVDPKKTLRHVLSRLHTAPCSRHVFFFFSFTVAAPFLDQSHPRQAVNGTNKDDV